MPRVVAYIRVSTNKQDLENQRHEIERYSQANNITVDHWDEDIASGTIQLKDREAGQMFARLREGDTLIVSEVSRISRSVGTLVTTLEDCIKRGVIVRSVKEAVTFKDDIMSDVMMVGLGLAAQLERRMISARTKEALARKRAEGVRLGRPPGQHRPENFRLHGHDEEIMRYLRKGISKAGISRLLDVSRSTLNRYINQHEIEERLLLERVRKSVVSEKRSESSSFDR